MTALNIINVTFLTNGSDVTKVQFMSYPNFQFLTYGPSTPANTQNGSAKSYQNVSNEYKII